MAATEGKRGKKLVGVISNLREGLARAFGVIRATAPVHLTDLFSCLLDETSSLRLPFRERMPNDATH